MKESKKDNTLNRRQFLKASGAAGAALGSVGLGFFGYEAGKDPSTYTGWETFEGGSQTFNRKPWEIDHPPYRKVGPTTRPDARAEVIFARMGVLMRNWNEETGLSGLPDHLQAFYKKNPEALEVDLSVRKEIFPKYMADRKKFKKQFILANAYSNAMGAVSPPRIDKPPEESDFPKGGRFGGPTTPLKMKDPKKTSELIKKMAHEFGATLVGIAKLNPDWVYGYPMRGRGFDPDKPIEVPKHWEYAVVIGTPMSWDPMYANPNYGTSNDAYSISRIVAFRVASFIKQLGYAARPHTPGTDYDLMVPPIAIDAGLGEQGRHSIVITPELGCNVRPAVITTNLQLQKDKPIDIGVKDFCKHCKICAEQCPSNSITTGGKKVIRGYEKYPFNAPTCFRFWNSNLGSMGCRLCIAACPYTRKANWVHKAAFNLSLYDPTGLADKALTGLQKIFYPGPDPKKYYMPSLGGENASYRKPPWWLRSEDFID
jgi:epoxyqueuosine reductase